ncbi:MAG: hypothetical protein RLP44_04300 [Aggregatilineales bacterium]
MINFSDFIPDEIEMLEKLYVVPTVADTSEMVWVYEFEDEVGHHLEIIFRQILNAVEIKLSAKNNVILALYTEGIDQTIIHESGLSFFINSTPLRDDKNFEIDICIRVKPEISVSSSSMLRFSS